MRQLLGNFSWIVLGNIISTFLRAATLLLLVRLAAPADFALYAAVFGVLVFGKAVSDLGLTKLIIRDRSLSASSKLHGQALRMNTLTSVSLGVAGTVVFFLAAITGFPAAWWLLPMPAAAALEKNADTWCSVHLADSRAHVLAIFTLIRRIMTLSLFTVIVSSSSLSPVLSMTLGELAAAVLSMIMVRWSLKQKINLPQKLNIRETFAASRPFWVHGLAMHSRNLDVSVVGLFAPTAQSAYFAAATRLSGPLQLIPSSMASVLLPHAARSQASGKGHVGRVILFTTLLFVPACVLLAFFIPELVPVLIGEDYQAAVVCIQIIILGLPLSVYSNLASAALQGEGFGKAVSRVSWAFAFTLLLAVAFGAGLWGADGAAMGTVLANAFLAVLVMYVWVRTRKQSGANLTISRSVPVGLE